MTEISAAVDILRRGGLVAFPTETVYGLGADATNSTAVDRIYTVKGRPTNNPLIVHIADIAQARRCATVWPDVAQLLAQRFWPGPLTLVLPKRRAGVDLAPDSFYVSDRATAGLATVGLRVPKHPLTLELLRAVDRPVAAPSANRSTHVSPTTAGHVRQELGSNVDLILDGGPCTVGIESTVLDLSEPRPRVLRPGAVTAGAISAEIGPIDDFMGSADVHEPALSPGQQALHYAPVTPAYRYETGRAPESFAENSVVLAFGRTPAAHRSLRVLRMPTDVESYSQLLYAVLREIDQLGLAAIYIELPPDEPQWAAIRDRLIRASQGR